MRETINNFFEKYVYYKPVTLDDFDIHNEKVYSDKKLKVEQTSQPVFDPNFGFEGERKLRRALATPEEVFSARLFDRRRDYCADHYIRYKACRRDRMVSFFGCLHYREEFMHCTVMDAVHNQKELEREKRLQLRNKRIKRMEVGLEN